MAEHIFKEVDEGLSKAKIQLLFEGDPDLRKAFSDLLSEACSGQGSGKRSEVSVKNEDILAIPATKGGKGDDGDSSKQGSDDGIDKKDADDGQDTTARGKSKQRRGKKKSKKAFKTRENTQVQSDDSIIDVGYDADDEKDADDDDKKSRKAKQKLELELMTGVPIKKRI